MNKNKLFFLILLLSTSFSLLAQQEPVGRGFSSSNRKSIEQKMSNLINRVSVEMNCPVDSLSYQILDKYTTFYSSSGRHLPQKIEFKGCGKTYVYKHNGLSGAVLHWLLGSWVQDKK